MAPVALNRPIVGRIADAAGVVATAEPVAVEPDVVGGGVVGAPRLGVAVPVPQPATIARTAAALASRMNMRTTTSTLSIHRSTTGAGASRVSLPV
jgi:hypothetical protein